MQPFIHPDTGNFEAIVYLFENEKKELLLEIKCDGFTLPSSVILKEDVVDKEYTETAVDKKAKIEWDLTLKSRELLCTLFYEEDMKHFNCYCYLCTQWDGEVTKSMSENRRYMWVDKMFAKNLLRADVDLQALAVLDVSKR